MICSARCESNQASQETDHLRLEESSTVTALHIHLSIHFVGCRMKPYHPLEYDVLLLPSTALPLHIIATERCYLCEDEPMKHRHRQDEPSTALPHHAAVQCSAAAITDTDLVRDTLASPRHAWSPNVCIIKT